MYNRYIPQPDGSYRRRSMSDPAPPVQRPPRREPQPEPEPERCEAAPEPDCSRCAGCPTPPPRPQRKPAAQSTVPGVSGFLKNLLPGNFDTEDLLIVLLLLLMSGDCREDRNLPLLTLALYLFL